MDQDAVGVIPHQSGYDLRALFRSVGRYVPQRALLASVAARIEPEVPAELLDGSVSQITAVPLGVAAFVDGIQAAVLMTYQEHRPAFLIYTAAGAVAGNYKPVGLREELVVACAGADRAWAEGLGGGVPIEELGAVGPGEVESEALSLIAGKREAAERALTTELIEQEQVPVLVDGSLVGRKVDTGVVGVVKSMRHRYLADESCLLGLREGWRSPRFAIPAGVGGAEAVRYSAYVRLFDATHNAWDFGLVRIEAFDPALLDALGALCLAERQGSRSGDGRWDRHIRGVRRCEEFLRARRPAVFTRL